MARIPHAIDMKTFRRPKTEIARVISVIEEMESVLKVRKNDTNYFDYDSKIADWISRMDKRRLREVISGKRKKA